MNIRTEKLISEYLPVLGRSALFTGISGEDIRSMIGCLNVSSSVLGYEETILPSAALSRSAGLLLDGKAVVRRRDFWGDVLAEELLEPGNLFAEDTACAVLPDASREPAGVPDAEIVSVSPAAVILWIDAAGFAAVCPSACTYHITLIRNLMGTLCTGALAGRDRMSHLTMHSTRQKLISYLSAEAARQHRSEFEIPLNRQELADFLLVERSAMSAQLSLLKKEGLIDFNRNRFRLIHRGGDH